MTALTPDQRQACRAVLEHHAKTFAWAAKFLREDVADHAAAVYAWCRRADDAIDTAPRAEHAAALKQLHAELDDVYGDSTLDDPLLGGFQAVVRARGIQRIYLDELLLGMEMDAEDTRYETLDDLLVYCYRVAGTVGLMMAHVLGVRDDSVLPRAAHLGMAMQLTNICRDIEEDHARKRCYLPDDALGENAARLVHMHFGQVLPEGARHAIGRARRELLALADRYYASADEGLKSLDWRSALGIRVARLGYAAIGDEIEESGVDAFEGRAYVPTSRKAALGLKALGVAVAEVPRRVTTRFDPVVPRTELRYPDVKLST